MFETTNQNVMICYDADAGFCWSESLVSTWHLAVLAEKQTNQPTQHRYPGKSSAMFEVYFSRRHCPCFFTLVGSPGLITEIVFARRFLWVDIPI
jgi:hypothetical protein